MTPEQKARVTIDALLQLAGWHVCNLADANIHAAVGVAIREFPLNNGSCFADSLLFVNGKAIESKKEGADLSGAEVEFSYYAEGLPPLAEQIRIIVETDSNLKRAVILRNSVLAKLFEGGD